MSVEGLNSILKQREQQFGPIIGETVNNEDSSEMFQELKAAIATLASNQQKLYQKLEEIEAKIEGK